LSDDLRGMVIPDKNYLKVREHCQEYQNYLLENILNLSVDNFEEIIRVKKLYKECLDKVKMDLI
jgi:hypothetical protein